MLTREDKFRLDTLDTCQMTNVKVGDLAGRQFAASACCEFHTTESELLREQLARPEEGIQESIRSYQTEIPLIASKSIGLFRLIASPLAYLQCKT